MSEWQEAGAGRTALPYPFYINVVTKRYFDGVDNKAMDQVLDCFTEDRDPHRSDLEHCPRWQGRDPRDVHRAVR